MITFKVYNFHVTSYHSQMTKEYQTKWWNCGFEWESSEVKAAAFNAEREISKHETRLVSCTFYLCVCYTYECLAAEGRALLSTRPQPSFDPGPAVSHVSHRHISRRQIGFSSLQSYQCLLSPDWLPLPLTIQSTHPGDRVRVSLNTDCKRSTSKQNCLFKLQICS